MSGSNNSTATKPLLRHIEQDYIIYIWFTNEASSWKDQASQQRCCHVTLYSKNEQVIESPAFWTASKVPVPQSYRAYPPKNTSYYASKHGGNRAIHNWAHLYTKTTSSNGSRPWFKLVLQRSYPVHSRRIDKQIAMAVTVLLTLIASLSLLVSRALACPALFTLWIGT